MERNTKEKSCDESKLTAEEKEELLIDIDTILKKYRLKKITGKLAMTTRRTRTAITKI
jgi:hypothetical protein